MSSRRLSAKGKCLINLSSLVFRSGRFFSGIVGKPWPRLAYIDPIGCFLSFSPPPPGPFAPQDPLCQINLMLLCWLCVSAGGRWVLDKDPCGAPQRSAHELIFLCGSVRETGPSLTASPRFLDCQLSGTLSSKCQVHIQICLPGWQCWKCSAL